MSKGSGARSRQMPEGVIAISERGICPKQRKGRRYQQYDTADGR
jgi:hypothetical protein